MARIVHNGEDKRELRRLRGVLRQIQAIDAALPRNPGDIAQPGSILHTLVTEELPDPPVDLRITVRRGVSTTAGTLTAIFDGIRGKDLRADPYMTMSSARTAMLASVRLLLALGPDDPDERRTNCLRVMRQEAVSLNRLYGSTQNFKVYEALVPPPHVLEQQGPRIQHLIREGPKLTETQMLANAADLLYRLMQARGETDVEAEHFAEGFSWVFNTYSGIAHGYGWPYLMPGSEDLHGHFLADIDLIVSVAYIALHTTASRCQVDPQ